jgi:hypothetical protein
LIGVFDPALPMRVRHDHAGVDREALATDEAGQSRRAERDELVHEMITAGKYSKPAAIDA